MRFKVSLEVRTETNGNVLPVSYQYELAATFHNLLTENKEAYNQWLADNNLLPIDNQRQKVYALSNLYIPRVFVEGDRMYVNVPRIQFWVSFLPEVGTRKFLKKCLRDKSLLFGDTQSKMEFKVCGVHDISPVEFTDTMDYQSLAPVVVKALRPNHSLDYLSPDNPYFSQFMIDEMIERWESLHRCRYEGDRSFRFTLLMPPRRKAVTLFSDTNHRIKEVGYMIKFRLEMDPVLQEFAYICGLGDDIAHGFGYIELLKKEK